MADTPAVTATSSTAAAAPAAAPAPVQTPMPELPNGVRLYECMWVIDANTGREDFSKVVGGLKEVVEKGGGTWVNGDKWEERRLAYPIKKKKRGLYVISHFSAPTENVVKIDRQAKLSDLVLRHMIVVDEDGLTTSPPVRGLDDDDFGGGGGGGGGGERRFFGGGSRGGPRGDRSGGPRGDRGDRGGPRSESGSGAGGSGPASGGAR